MLCNIGYNYAFIFIHVFTRGLINILLTDSCYIPLNLLEPGLKYQTHFTSQFIRITFGHEQVAPGLI